MMNIHENKTFFLSFTHTQKKKATLQLHRKYSGNNELIKSIIITFCKYCFSDKKTKTNKQVLGT